MDQQNRERTLQSPRRLLELEQRLDRARDEPRFAVQEEKRDHTDERWQHHGKRDERPQRLAAGEIEPLEQKGERNTDCGGQHGARERYPETRPQRRPVARTRQEVVPCGTVCRLCSHDDDRVQDEPRQEQRHGDGDGERPPGAAHRLVPGSGSTITRVAATWTRWSMRAASGCASTSNRSPSSPSTRKNVAGPV